MTTMAEQFEAERARLIGVAYRLLGSVSDAEDIVQEAYLRWADQAGQTIDNPPAFLTTVVSRLALDRLRSAQHQREHYVGPWLPEPMAVEAGPDESAILAESLTMGFLTVLERLGPVARAVFVLHDVFGLPFGDVATIVDRSEENCRQIARRARDHIHSERPRFTTDEKRSDDLVGAFLQAVIAGEVEQLERLLAEDVVHVSDGGADHRAARKPVVGRDRVARLFVNLATRAPEGATVERRRLNGEPGVVVLVDGVPFTAFTIHIVDGLITNLFAVVNPTKIAHLAQP